MTSAGIPVLRRRGATAVAAGRLALGLTALAWPLVPARPSVGAAANDLACAWVAAGALSDALDVVASLFSWREPPRTSRWLVVLSSAGGAALAGTARALGRSEIGFRDRDG